MASGDGILSLVQLVKPELYTLTVEQLQSLPAVVQEAVSVNMSALRTNGDGCCAMHAFLGSPKLTSIGSVELWKADARIEAISHCGPSLEILQDRSCISSALRSIQTSLWKDFVEGHLQGHITSESTNFWNMLHDRNPEAAQEAQALFDHTASCDDLYDRVKTEVVEAARSFFP